MPQIRILDEETVNQIAAGEVVERPSSIVKELVENAIDAKSTAITVEIKGGGIDFIRITDNGCGIAGDQVRSAFLPHATSKIRSADDLQSVRSLGFRGEALSSIAAVSKVELITKTDEGISGIRYVIEGGQETHMEEIGCPEGSTFLVRNLFYNTPARYKFLKSKMTESGYVEAYMQRLALSRPDISFKLIHENKNKIATSGNGSLKDVIYHIFGREIAMNLLPVSYEDQGITVEGFIGKPTISRGNRNYENYFVNGRYLKNNIISRAIEEGYKGHAMVHKFPFTALMISMDPKMADVNVHPSKLEMRFHNGEALYYAISEAVRRSFVKKELIPAVSLEREKEKPAPVPATPEPFEKKRRSIEERFQNLTEDKKKEIREKKQEPPPVEKEPEKAPAVHSVREPADYGKQISFADIPVLSEAARPRHRMIGQVFDTYWMMEYEDKLYFVDQHAAHEKVMYEKLMAEMAKGDPGSQMLSPPVIVTFSMKEKAAFEKCQDVFAGLGFIIEPFGENDYAIRGIPLTLLGMNAADFFVGLFDELDMGGKDISPDIITGRVATMACKAAVKGNTRMSMQEMDALMDSLLKLENPYQCPHGRPTMISMSRYEMEKKFKRIQQ